MDCKEKYPDCFWVIRLFLVASKEAEQLGWPHLLAIVLMLLCVGQNTCLLEALSAGLWNMYPEEESLDQMGIQTDPCLISRTMFLLWQIYTNLPC